MKGYLSAVVIVLADENQSIISHCPSSAEYRPTPWIFNRLFMTTLGIVFRSLPKILFQRVRLSGQ